MEQCLPFPIIREESLESKRLGLSRPNERNITGKALFYSDKVR